jgi:hypothetical protein
VPLIFVSYRREDTRGGIIGRLCDRLEARFGKGSVFVDIEAIPAGFDFRSHIEKVMQDCDVVLAVIGPGWAGTNSSGSPRIFQQDDWVRTEIETALKRGIPVIPVLVDRSPMPKAEDLPAGLRPFAYLQKASLDSEDDFHVHAARLIRAIERHLGWKASRSKRWLLPGAVAAVVLVSAAAYVFPRLLASKPEAPIEGNLAAIQACNAEFEMLCAQQGGIFGATEAVAGLRNCKGANIVRSDDASLHWRDVWTTSVYSYAPGGGGPGGGRDDDELKVGGWGDWYYSLIQFDLPPLQRRPQFAAIALYSKPDQLQSVPLALDRIIQHWDFPKGDRLWWKDRPGTRAVSADYLAAPRQAQWYAIDLTSLVQEWFDGKSPDYGIQIRPAGNFGSIVIFVSSDSADKAKIPRLIFCA